MDKRIPPKPLNVGDVVKHYPSDTFTSIIGRIEYRDNEWQVQIKADLGDPFAPWYRAGFFYKVSA